MQVVIPKLWVLAKSNTLRGRSRTAATSKMKNVKILAHFTATVWLCYNCSLPQVSLKSDMEWAPFKYLFGNVQL